MVSTTTTASRESAATTSTLASWVGAITRNVTRLAALVASLVLGALGALTALNLSTYCRKGGGGQSILMCPSPIIGYCYQSRALCYIGSLTTHHRSYSYDKLAEKWERGVRKLTTWMGHGLGNHGPAVQVSMRKLSESSSVLVILDGKHHHLESNSQLSSGLVVAPLLTDDNMDNWRRVLISSPSAHSACFAKFCFRLANGGQPLAR